MQKAPRPFAHPTTRRRSPGRARPGALASFASLAPLVAAILSLAAGLAPRARSEDVPASLEFRVHGERLASVPLATLVRACGERTIEVDDPYHGRGMRYRAVPLRCALDQGFAARGGAASLGGESLLLRARDGYARSAPGSQLGEPNAFLAFGEPGLEEPGSGRPRFSRIDRRQVDPAPFYLVWTGVEKDGAHAHPWPYQLVTVEIARFEDAFPHTVPRDLPKADAGWRGYSLFQASCSACHAINGEGGTVGPDLNVPKSIVEYRPVPQIRAYVRDPQATRYTSMPAHPQLSDADLDALIAYFEAMRTRKHDPNAGAAAEAGAGAGAGDGA